MNGPFLTVHALIAVMQYHITSGSTKVPMFTLFSVIEMMDPEEADQKEQPPGSNCQALEVDHQEQTR